MQELPNIAQQKHARVSHVNLAVGPWALVSVAGTAAHLIRPIACSSLASSHLLPPPLPLTCL